MEKQNEIIRLYNDQFTCKEIAQKLSIHRTTVSNILKKAGIKIEKRHNKEKKITLENKRCLICDKKISKRRNICNGCYTSVRRYRIKKWMIDYKGGKCVECGDSSLNVACYDFHHIDKSEKEFGLSRVESAKINIKQIIAELDKCNLVCANCHRAKHTFENHKLITYANLTKINFLKVETE